MEEGGRRTEDRGRRTEDGGGWTEEGGGRTEDGGEMRKEYILHNAMSRIITPETTNPWIDPDRGTSPSD